MRQISLLLLLIIATSSVAQNLPTGVSSTDMVGWWPFDGNAQDESVNGYDVTVNTATLTEDRFGNVNSAYEFTNSYMAVQDAAPILSMGDNYTISMWFRTNDIYDDTQCLLNTSTHNYISLNFNHSSIADESMVLYTGNGSWTTMDGVIIGGDYDGGGFIGANSTNNALEGMFNTYVDDGWYHYVLVKDGDNYKTYANGCLDMHYIDSGAGGGLVGVIFGAIGNPYPYMSEYFNGTLDDIGIWQRVLSEEEISALSESYVECTDPDACNYTPSTFICPSSIYNEGCEYCGCTDSTACNYDSNATQDDNSCTYPAFCLDCDGNNLCGCTDPAACNYDSAATQDDGLCEYLAVDLGPDLYDECGSVPLDAGAGYDSYLWSPNGETSQTINVTESGNYSVEVEIFNTSIGSAIEFDGTGYVDIDSPLGTTGSDGISFSFHIKNDWNSSPADPTGEHIFDFGNSPRYVIKENNGNIEAWGEGGGINLPPGDNPLQVDMSDYNNTYCHVVVVFANIMQIYVDGQLLGELNTGYNGSYDLSAPSRIGANDSGSPTYNFIGILDEITVWDYPLSSIEVQNLMDCDADISSSYLFAYWDCDTNNENILQDQISTDNDNSGAMIGGVTFTDDGWSCSPISSCVGVASDDINITFGPQGCTNEEVCNYDVNAICDDGSCLDFDIQIESTGDLSCFSYDCNDGFVDVTLVGGTGYFNCVWTSNDIGFSQIDFITPSSSENVIDLVDVSAGTYTLTVTEYASGLDFALGNDIGECSIDVSLLEPAPLSLEYTFSEYVCADTENCDGQISIDVDGGQDPYLFELINNGEVLQTSNSGIFNGVCAGDYSVSIYDSNWYFCPDDLSACYMEIENISILESSNSISADLNNLGCGLVESVDFDFSGNNGPYDIELYLNNSLIALEADYESNNWSYPNSDLQTPLPESGFELELFLINDLGCPSQITISSAEQSGSADITNIDIFNPLCPETDGSFDIEFINYDNELIESPVTLTFYLDQNNNCELDFNEEVTAFNQELFDIQTNETIVLSEQGVYQELDLSPGNYLVEIATIDDCIDLECFTINYVPEFNSDIYFTYSGDNTCYDESGSATVSWDPLDVGGTAIVDTTFLITSSDVNSDTVMFVLNFNNSDLTFNIEVECNGDVFIQDIEDNGDGVIDEEDIVLFLAENDDFCGGIISSSDPVILGPYFSDPYYIIEWIDINNPLNTFIPDGWNSVTELSAGEYEVTVIDANGCQDVTNFTIEQPPAAFITGATSSISTTTCCNSCDGEITISPYGGVADFYIVNVNYISQQGVSTPYGNEEGFDLDPGNNPDITLSGLCPGQYEIIVHDSTNEILDVCEPAEDVIDISSPECLDWIIETEPLECYGDILIWEGVGDNAFYSVPQTGAVLYWFAENEDPSLNNLNNALDVYNLGVGIYNLLSVDPNGCVQDMGQWEIEGPDQLQSDINIYESDTLIYCNGFATGVIAINTYYLSNNGVFSEATDPITYLWYFNGTYMPQYDNQNIVENLPAGTYDILVNNQYDCGPIPHTVEVIEPEPLYVDFDHSDLLCYGDDNGAITLDIQGGLLDEIEYVYLVDWSIENNNGEEEPIETNELSLNNLEAGVYTAYVTTGIPGETSFCDLVTIEIPIESPPLLEIGSAQISFVSCEGELDGGLDIEIIGGTPPYTFDWDFIQDEFNSDGNLISEGAYSVNNQGNIVNSVAGLGEGIYALTVTDANNCDPISYILDLAEPLELIYESGDETVLQPAYCSVGNGNFASGQIAIHLNDLFSQITGGTPFNNGNYSNPFIGVDETCSSVFQDGDIVGDSIIFSNLIGDMDYTICLTDSVGCLTSYSVFLTIDNPEPIEITLYGVDANCDANGAIYIENILYGTPPYEIVVYNNNGSVAHDFSIDDYVQWFELDPLTINGFTFNNFDWNNNNVNDIDTDVDGDGIPNNQDGDIDGDGIPNIDDQDIDGDGVSNFGLDGIEGNGDDDGTPYDGNLDPDFYFSYFGWYDEVAPGDYYITITDSKGCTGESVSISVLADIPSAPVSTVNGNCYVNTNQTCDSLNSNGAIEINPNATGFVSTLYPYYIFLDGELIDVVEEWDMNADGFDDIYVINSSDTTVAGEPIVIEAGTAYTVSIINGNGCGYLNNNHYYEIGFLSNLNVNIVGFCPECEESSNGGFAYTLNSIENDVLSGLGPEISVEIVGPANNNDLNILYTNTNTSNSLLDCVDNIDIDGDGYINSEDIDMDGDGIDNYADSDIDNDGVLNGLDIDMDGVLDNVDSDLDGDDLPDLDGSDLDSDGILDDVQNSFNPSANGYNYTDANIIQFNGIGENYYLVDNMWWDYVPDPNALVNYHQDYLHLLDDTTDYIVGGFAYGNYEITIIDQYGCQFTESINISNETCQSQFGSQQWENCLFIPSVFTPNSDGINDLWDIYNIELYEDTGVKITVFNRWGQIVYQNTATNNMFGTYSDKLWNGESLEGNSVEIATYYYVIELDEFDKNYTGYVVVKR